MRLFGWRRKPSAPDRGPGLPDPLERLRILENELREIRLQVEFMRTRLSCYVGDGIALTYLADETPMFVNANDIGGPFNLLNGGRYEEDNVEVLLSFVRDDTVFLDIGANVGFYTLQVGRRVFPNGKIYSFEPNPQLHELLSRNVYVNGFADIVECFRLGLSDRDCTATFQYPRGHLGGGHIGGPGLVSGHTAVEAEIRRLDDLLGAEFRCDLVKIDVEGHEINVLNGMKRIVENSPEIKILFEKLTPNAATDVAVESYFSGLGFELYGVRPDASLAELGTGGLGPWSGYVIAARPGTIEGGLRRARFSLRGGQLSKPNSSERGVVQQRGSRGEMLFHGPYWLLRPGIWRCKVHGEIRGMVSIYLLERFGYPVLNFVVEEGKAEHVFTIQRDLMYFECAAYAASPEAEITLERVEFIREV
ncbi:MAG TPA: FkbM family methyltransferase [Stellaceae bacterium]